MRWPWVGLFGLFITACGLGENFYGECFNTRDYRIIALRDGKKFDQGDAKILCTKWSAECSSTDQKTLRDCKCLSYKLSSEDIAIAFPPLEEGGSASIPGGKITITSKRRQSEDCSQGNNSVDYAGVFEGKIAGHSYRRGVFYAPGEP
jgi:hypothetical protein